jgi:hypothetical protein
MKHIDRIMSGKPWLSLSVLVLTPCRFLLTGARADRDPSLVIIFTGPVQLFTGPAELEPDL